MTHCCAAPGCTIDCPTDKLMCLPHWKRLPLDLQRKVYATWNRVRREPEPYREAREEAVEWLRRNSPESTQGSLL